jgi:serine/threonine protein kinase
VHRDIKPANLLLRDDGEVKLTDFGAALSQKGDITQMAGLVGSPAYMSPEQIRDEKLTQQSDMFSLGVVL